MTGGDRASEAWQRIAFDLLALDDWHRSVVLLWNLNFDPTRQGERGLLQLTGGVYGSGRALTRCGFGKRIRRGGHIQPTQDLLKKSGWFILKKKPPPPNEDRPSQ